MPSKQYFVKLEKLINSLEQCEAEELLQRMCDIIDLSKAESDTDTTAEFAKHLIQASNHFGRFDYEMRAFGEMRLLYKQYERLSDLRHDVIWYYKWIAERVPEHVEVPKQKVFELLDQMEEFYKQEEAGLRPVHTMRFRAASFMGLKEEAEFYFKKWENESEDETDDCPACTAHGVVQYLLEQGQVEKAIEVAKPILEGTLFCDEVPAITASRLLLPLWAADRTEEALTYSLMVRRQVRKVPKLLAYLADHVVFLTAVGALNLAARNNYVMLAKSDGMSNSADLFSIYRAAWIYFSVQGKFETGPVAISDRCELGRLGNLMPVKEAAAWCEQKTRDIARQFDERNGTGRFMERLQMAERIALLNPEDEAGG